MKQQFSLSQSLPIPKDDGACDHLAGLAIPSISLSSTDGEEIDLGKLQGRTIVYCYPLSARPGFALPKGWDDIPGARGCTPQSCAYRDEYSRIISFGVCLFGLSSQRTEYQREMVERLHLPFRILSDVELEFASALKLPTFKPADSTLIKRLTLVISDGRIEKVFYPVFPPDSSATDVINWLESANGELIE